MILPETYGFGVRTEPSGLNHYISLVLRISKQTPLLGVFNDWTEWKLDQQVLSDTFFLLGKPDLGLFASRLDHQLTRYVSWIPDPNAVGVDAFTLDWEIVCFSSFQFNSTSSAKGGRGSSRSNLGGSSLANPVLVSQNKTPGAVPSATSQSSQHCTPALQFRKGISIGGKTGLGYSGLNTARCALSSVIHLDDNRTVWAHTR